jgi:hypothetical protein
MAEEDPTSRSASPKVEDSMEVDLEVKEEQEAGEDGASDAAPRAAKSGEPVTNQQYKALKEITEKLTNETFQIIMRLSKSQLPLAPSKARYKEKSMRI